MLTFARGPAKLASARGPLGIAAACVSVATLLPLCVYTAWRRRKDIVPPVNDDGTTRTAVARGDRGRYSEQAR